MQIVYGHLIANDPGPEGDDSPHPLNDPKLLLKVNQWADSHKKKGPRPDDGISDPMPMKLVKGADADLSPEGEAMSALGTQAGAQVKWKFIGVKPGSGVTDPAEPQGPRGDSQSGVAPIKHFEVIDPGETETAAAAWTGSADDTAQAAVVGALEGKVEKLAEQGGRLGWMPVAPGDRLHPGDVLRMDKQADMTLESSDIMSFLTQQCTPILATGTHTLYRLDLH